MQILKKPIVTEKVTEMNEKGIYGFIVDRRANKIQIKKAVEENYGVNVDSVRTMNYQGKAKVRYTRTKVISGRQQSFKKAIVQVAEGEFIDLYENL